MPDQISQKLNEAAQIYRDIVVDVLETLRQKDYPTYTLWEDGPVWAIGYQSESDYGSPLFWHEVSVYLKFDDRNNPVSFICQRHGTYVRKKENWLQTILGHTEWKYKFVETDLSETELSNALAQLHPADGSDTTTEVEH